MSEFIRRLNTIKRHRDFSWLTPSQQTACSTIGQTLRVPGTINMFGKAGVGKTFLSWNLAERLNYCYVSHQSEMEKTLAKNTDGIIIDNCSHSRTVHREILKWLQFHQIVRAVLVTRHLIQDYTHYVEVHLTNSDLAQVKRNLIRINLTVTEREEMPNLWSLVNPALWSDYEV